MSIPEPISESDYLLTQTQIGFLANLVRDMPLHEFLAAISHADTVAPIVDPIAWIRGEKEMHKIERLALGLLQFQKVIHELMAEVENRGPQR